MEKMSGLLNNSKVFFKRNSPTILTVLGGVGSVATAVMAVKATPKALRLIEEAEREKEERLTKAEVITVAGPVYIPALVMSVGTLACIFGANLLSKHQQASLVSAYTILENSYKQYKTKVKDLYGKEFDKRVREEIAKDNYEETDVEDGKQLFYDEFSQRYFESTMEDVLTAEYEINRLLAQDSGVYLNEFYDLLGIDEVDYGNYLGWSSFELVETYWYCWVEFEHTKVEMEDGMECTIITILKEPTFDFENY